MRLPPRSTLFPYPSLFLFKTVRLPQATTVYDPIARKTVARDTDTLSFELKARQTAIFFLDRKSTRLNSSHANISYAVFCLKKKKTNKLRYLIHKHDNHISR